MRWLVLLLLTLPAVVQAQFIYTTNNGTITITGYTGPGGEVSIPDSINGLPVASIAGQAFYFRTSVTRVTIPGRVTFIGVAAFSGCSSLTSITIPSSVTGIEDETFVACSNLASVTILGSVTNIGGSAFDSCTSLTSISIPSSVLRIGEFAFRNSSSLAGITVDAGNSNYASVDGVLFNKSRTKLIQWPGGKTGNYTIPSGVNSIAIFAFQGCTNLTSVTIPDSVTNIFSHQTFSDCYNLTNVMIGSGVTSIGNFTFFRCSSLTSVTIGSGVTSIGYSAFFSCTRLTGITIPSSVSTIGNGAFENCTSLNGVYFQGNAPGVGSSVFEGTTNATVYYMPGTISWGPTFGERPTALWVLPNPVILNNGPSFGVRTNQFGFVISWATNASVVVEACTDLAQPLWSPVGTNTLTDGSSYFSDPQWTNHPTRFYRLRSP